ncbi:MAG: hypothetical protein IJM30_01285 [Thermoguttaceae bacterium]|nr:hypothetical protein [Thermoguttaceae bacterium]
MTISGLSEATTYYFRVKATATGHDESGWSSPFEARTIVSYNSSDLAVVQGFGLTATSEGVVWNDEGRLAELTLADSALTNVEIQNCTALTKLDVSRCANLELLKCPNNNLEELLFTGCDNLKYLWCRNNNLCELDVSGFGKLRGLNCKNNKLTLLNVSNCAMLSYIECDDNNLTDLSITCCENLARIECHNNSLTDLNLSGLDNLVVIECHGNSLTELDVSNCVNLVSLYIDYSVRKLTLSEERESIGSLYVRTCEDWDSIEVSVVSGSQPIIGRIDTGGYVYRTVRGLNTATDPITITYRKNGGLVGTTSINDIEQLANPEVSVGAIATDSVVFDFGEVENATSYVVEYSTNSDFADSSTATFATFGAATISDLLPGTRYYFRVKVTATGFGDSDWTTLEATTLADAGGLTLVGATSNAIVLAIGEVEGATGYVVEYGTDPEFGSFETETFATFGNATIFGLSAATTYYLRVKATAPEWDGIWSTRIVAATSLATPTIELKTKTTNSITLTLGAVAQGINYVLEYATDESFTSTATKVCQSGDVTVTGLSNATAYYFRVKATSTEYEESEWSSPFEARTVVTYNADDLAIIEGFGLTATSDGVVWNDEGRLVELTIVDSWRMVVEIECDSLKKLDLNGCANLRTIKCSCVNLTELNFSQCEKLSNLICPNNKLTKLEISDKVEFFFSLVIYNTNIKYLDLTNIKANCLELIIANDIPYIWVPNDLFALSLCSDKAEGVYYTDAYDSVVRSDGNGNTVPFMKGYPTMWGGHFNSFPSSFVITFLKNGEPVGTTVINGPRVLDSPTVALVSATDAEVVLDIAEVENAANYIVEYSDDPNFADFSTATFATPGLATITGLLPTTTYYFRVKATSTGFDDSPWSTVGVEATTILAIPTIALKSKTDVSVTLTIGEVARGTNYVLEYGTDESFASATSIACQPGDVTISGLSEATTYYFRIRVTAFGYAASEWSSPFDARTASYYDEDDLAFLESVGLTATSEGVYWNESRRLYHVLIKNGNYESIVVPTSCDALETIVFSDASDANVKCQKLDVSGCVALHTIYCERIDLNELDVSGCGNLKYLFCYDNNLTSLDVSNCPELVILECQGNSFQSLDLSNCPNLKLFYFDSSLKTVSMDRSSINEFNVYQTNEWDSVSVVDGNGSSYSYTNRFTSWSEYSSSYRIIYRWTNLDTATDPITFSYFKNGELVGTTVINGMEQLDSPSAEVVSATSDEVVLDVGEVEDATSYVVEYSTNSDFADSSSATFATFGNATISDLLPGTRYYFRIKATARGYGDSEWTSLQETTLSESQEPTLVEATSDAIVLAICEIVNATSYVVEYGTDPEFDSFETETFATFGNATISGLSAATTYYFRVKATSSGWIYPWSTIIAATTKLATPSLQIKANVKTAYSVGLTIGEVMGAEGYSVEWSTSPAFASVSSKTFDGFGEKTITGLSPATIYYFRVKATSTLFGASAPSAEVVATTNLATPSIAVKNQTVDSITLTIGSVNQGENYAIEYSTSESFESALAIVRQPGDSTISGLQAATLYYFRVKATATGFDASAWSTPVVAITDARAPTLAYKSKTDNSIEVAIGAIDDATSYILEYSTSSDFASNAVFVTYGEPGDKTITDLVPSATYYFRVRSILSDGIESSWSSSVAIATNLATPFLAIDYRTKTVNSIVLTISPTLVDNVNRATSYSIEYSKDPTFALGGGEATLATSGTSAVTALISHLDPATTYYFRVKATSEIWDDSAWSSATSATTNLASPALLCKSTSGNSATLVIGAVDRATNYAVEYSTDPTFGSSSTKTFSVSQIAESAEQTISGLIPSTPYYFRVKATANGFDDSSWSSVVDARTGVAIPSLSYGSKTASTISLSLNDVGYWENENYELWYWEVAYPGVRTQITASTPSLLVNRLQPATTYTFRVRTIAEDESTVSEWGYSEISTTLATPSLAVKSNSRTGNSVILEVGEVAEATGCAIQYSTDPSFPSAATRTATFAASGERLISGLDAATTYYFRVKATSDNFDESSWSSSEVKETTLLATPTRAIVAKTSDSVTISIGAVEKATEYTIVYALDEQFSSGKESKTFYVPGEQTITGLRSATDYYFYVVASSAEFGDSARSNYLAATTNLATPVLSVAETNVDLISFAIAPVEKAGTYVVQCATDASFATPVAERTVPALEDQTAIDSFTGLTCGTTYYLRVKATATNYDESAWSTEIETTTALAPPTLSVAAKDDSSIALSIGAVQSATIYELQYSTDPEFNNLNASVTTRGYLSPGDKAIVGLTPATTYYFRVKATTETGGADSLWTNLDATTNLATPAIAVKDKTSSTATLAIGAVERATGYVVEYSTDPEFSASDPSTTTVSFAEPGAQMISGLTAGKTYRFRVKAIAEEFDASAWSTEEVRATTNLEAPVLTAIETIDASSVSLTFDYPDGFDGSFVLQYSTNPKFEYSDAPVTSQAFASEGTKTITGLSAASTYYFRVKATAEACDDSAWSNRLDATTDLPTPVFSFSYASESSVILSINSISEAKKFVVLYADFAFDPNSATLPSGATSFEIVPNGAQAIMRQISGLKSDTTYFFYVKASAVEPTVSGPAPKSAAPKNSAPKTSALPIYRDSSFGFGTCNLVRDALGAPTLFVEKSTSGSITLSISESNFRATSVASSYIVQYSTSPNFPEGDPSRNSTWSGELVTTETGGWIRTEFENLTFDNLLSGTTYYFRVKAKSATAGVSDSDWNPAPDGFGFQVFETTAVGLAAPSVSIASTTADSATVNIGAVPGSEVYEVEYGMDPEFKTPERRVFSSSGQGTIPRLTPATNYYFRVRAKAATGDVSTWSTGRVEAKTALETPALVIEATSPTSATLRVGSSGRATRYLLEYSTDPSFASAATKTYNAPGVKTISDLTPGATYYFRVKATASGYGDSEPSTPIDAKTALPSPTISALAVESGALSFVLDELSGAEYYVVQYGTDATFAPENATELNFDAPGEKRIEGLTPGTLYYLRVMARVVYDDFAGDSDWLVVPATTAFAAPTIAATVASSSAISLNIGASASAKSYVVEYGTEPSFASAASKTFANPGEQKISGLDPDSTYYFRVKATAPGRGESAWSTSANATTEAVGDSRLVVYRTDDTGRNGSLRYAVERANDGETIFVDLEPGDEIVLQSELIVDKAITIDASSCWDDSASAPGVTVTTEGVSRVFNLTASATLVGLAITGGKASEGAGVLVAEGVDANLTRCVVTGNEAFNEPSSTYAPVYSLGGGISARGALTLDRCVVVENSASTPECANTAYAFGGGIYATGELTARETVIAENQTSAKAQNVAHSYGAGLYASGAATLIDCDVRANESLFASPNSSSASALFSYGGGVFAVRSLTVDNSRFIDNIARQKGGAIYVSQGAKVEIANDTILRENKSYSFGGGIYSEGDLSVTERCSLIANQSESGGAIYSSGKLTLADALVRDNIAESGYLAMGGGLYLSGAASVDGATIYNNVARVPGSDTGAVARGGGVYADSTRDASLTNCSIVANSVETTSTWSATAQGGGVYSNFVGASFIATNCEISQNTASAVSYGSSQYATATSQGGGVYAARALSLVNATVVANSVDAFAASATEIAAGDGAYLQRFGQADKFSFDNAIVILNGVSEDDLRRSDPETLVLGRNSLSSFDDWSNESQTGVVNYGYSRLEPLFEDFEGGDYRPALNSQLVDRGDSSNFPVELSVDLDGADRFYRAIDLGAYEFQGANERRLDSPSVEASRAGTSVTLQIAAKDESAERYVLDYGTDPTFANYSSVTYNSPGAKTLTGVPADATLYFRVRAEALGRISSVWTRDCVGTKGESAEWIPTTDALPDALEPNDSRADAAALGTLTSAIAYDLGLSSGSDVDWFKLSTVATGGEENFARVDYAQSRDGTSLTVDLYDARGRKVASASGATGTARVSFNNLPSGEYWIKVSNARPDGRAADYRLTIDPPVAIETKLPRPGIAVASSASGATVEIENVDDALGYLVQYGTDPDFVDAAEKTYLASGAKTLAGLAPSTLYYVRVKALANAPTNPDDSQDALANEVLASDSDWTLATVTTDAIRDRFEPNDLSDEAIDLGAVVGGNRFDALNLHSGSDVDWYKFSPSPSEGAELAIELTGSDANLSVELFDAEGNRVAVSIGALGVETISVPSGEAEYWLRVASGSARPSAVEYALAFVERTALTAPTVAVGETASDSVALQIGAVDGATRCVVQRDVDPEFSAPVTVAFDASGSSVVDGLRPETTYYFRVKATAEGRADSAWTEIAATTTAIQDVVRLDAPTVSTPTVAKTSITFKLSAVASATKYVLEYGTDPTFATSATKSYTTVGSKTVSGLEFGTTYYFRVKATTTSEGFVDSNWTTFEATTKKESFESAPTLSATAATTDSIAVEIGSVAGTEQYVLEYDTSAVFAAPIPVASASVGSQTISGLAPGTEYFFRVKATAARYDDSAWTVVSATTESDSVENQLASPTVSTPSTTKAAVTFKITAVANATSYVLEYGTDPNFATKTTKNYTTVGSKTLSGLAFGTTYYFRLKATATGYVDSEWTTFEATTKKESLAFAPTLVSNAIGFDSATVEIGAVASAERYVLEYSTSANFASAASVEFASPGLQTVPGLASSATYYFRVKAAAARYEDSAWSETISATTLDPSGVALDVPSITALSGTKTAIVVKFDAIDGAAKYVVEYSTDSKFANSVAKTYSTAGSKTISGLPTGTWFYVRMKATATGRPDSAYTEVRKIYTGGSYATPSFTFSAVKTAVVLNIKPGKIDAAQGAPEKYVVEYSESPDFSNAKSKTFSQGFNDDGTLKPCKPTISGLVFGTSYYFRVKATGSLGNDSGWNANNGKPIAAGQLAVPTFFTSKIGTDFINVRCYNSAGASGFEVMFSTSSDFANPQYAQCSASSGTVAMTGLDPSVKYYYKVRALGDNVSRVNSTWSVIVNNATTKASASCALLDEESDFENYLAEDELEEFWDVLAKSIAK